MPIKIEGQGPHPFPAVEKVEAVDDYGRGVVVKVWTKVEGQPVSVDVFLNKPQAKLLQSELSACLKE